MCNKDNCNDSYNGWSNYETWLVSLWLNNDEQTLFEAKNRIHAKTGLEACLSLKDFASDICLVDLPSSGLANDLLNSALGSVDWSEIVNSLNEA